MILCIYLSDTLVSVVTGLLTGFITSIVATKFTTYKLKLKTIQKQKEMFENLSGTYFGYSYKDENEWEINEEKQSRVKITYLNNNLLSLVLTDLMEEHSNIWEGKIIMETNNTGTLTWWYNKYKGLNTDLMHHKFGIKRIVVKEINSKLYVYLVEENLISKEKFKKEVLIKE